MKMLMPAARVRLLSLQGDYEIDNVIYAALLHKKIMALATINSVTTTKTLSSNLRELPTYCFTIKTIKGGIELLHSYFDTNYKKIIARGATLTILSTPCLLRIWLSHATTSGATSSTIKMPTQMGHSPSPTRNSSCWQPTSLTC